jgi:hypothetical protein
LNGYQNATDEIHCGVLREQFFFFGFFEKILGTEIRDACINHNQKTIPDQPVMYAEASVLGIIH